LSLRSNGGEIVSESDYETRRKDNHSQSGFQVLLKRKIVKIFKSDRWVRPTGSISELGEASTTTFASLSALLMQKIINKRRQMKANQCTT
jgi:hypothetical protein